jgi:MFS transporter, SHS family, sialic acid transporter
MSVPSPAPLAPAKPLLPPAPTGSNFGQWMALAAALLGWLFDGLEMGLFPLVQNPALRELLASPDLTPEEVAQKVVLFQGIITSFFLIGAATGGVLFGWLGDRIGRVRSMMLSVLTYALVSALCGIASSAWEVGLYRFIAALGMGGEWSLGVALITEIWPNRSRAFLAGLIGAAANVGYLLIALVGWWVLQSVGQAEGLLYALGLPESWVTHLLRNDGWRLLMMFGAVPALLTFFIRIFVPESERWEREKERGATSHWASRDLLAVLVGAVGACGIIYLWAVPVGGLEGGSLLAARVAGTLLGLAVATLGYTFPIVRYMQRAEAAAPAHVRDSRETLRRMLLAACLSAVALLGTWGTTQQAPAWADATVKDYLKANNLEGKPPAKEHTQIAGSAGAIVGTIVAALLGGWLGRRITYCLLCVTSLIIVPLFFFVGENLLVPAFVHFETPALAGYWLLAFLAGAITASFYGWLPLYLPELFRTAVRATGQGFGYNFGRIIAAIGVLQLGTLRGLLGDMPHVCMTLSLVYLVGLVLIWTMPETKGQPLPD